MESHDPEQIEFQIVGDVAIVRLPFQRFLGVDDAERVQMDLSNVAGRERVTHILLNCGALDYCQSRLLGILAELSKRLRKQGGSLAICRMRPEALNAFRLTRLHTIIPVYSTEEDALTALRTS